MLCPDEMAGVSLGGVACPGGAGAAGAAGAPAGEDPLPLGASCVETQVAGVCVLPSSPGMVPPRRWYRRTLQRQPSLAISRAVAVWDALGGLWAAGFALCAV